MLHNFDFLIRINNDFRILFINFSFADQKGILELGHWLLVIELNLSLLYPYLNLEVGLSPLEEVVYGLVLLFLGFQFLLVLGMFLFNQSEGIF